MCGEQDGAAALKRSSPFRYIADSGISAMEHHEGTLTESIDLPTWVTMAIQRSVETIQSRLQGGLAFLAYAFITLAQRAQRSTDDTAIRLEALVAVLYAFVVFMSLVYLGLASSPGQFDELHTRIDALYYAFGGHGWLGLFGVPLALGAVILAVRMILDRRFNGPFMAGYAALGAAYIIAFDVATGPWWTQTVAQIAK